MFASLSIVVKRPFRFDNYQATHFHALSKPFFSEEICPDIMIEMLMRFKDKPIMITENGIAVEDDHIRIVYLAAMLQAMKQGMDLGAQVIGYLHWSLLDNWEWGTYHPTFGLATVDSETFDRKLKQSGQFYGDIAKIIVLIKNYKNVHGSYAHNKRYSEINCIFFLIRIQDYLHSKENHNIDNKNIKEKSILLKKTLILT